MNFDRYRAYAAATGTSSKPAVDSAGALIRDADGNAMREITQEWPIEDVAFAGDAVDGMATFDAGDTVISRVVFYAGPEDGERVCGNIDVNASGSISVSCPDLA